MLSSCIGLNPSPPSSLSRGNSSTTTLIYISCTSSTGAFTPNNTSSPTIFHPPFPFCKVRVSSYTWSSLLSLVPITTTQFSSSLYLNGDHKPREDLIRDPLDHPTEYDMFLSFLTFTLLLLVTCCPTPSARNSWHSHCCLWPYGRKPTTHHPPGTLGQLITSWTD